MTFLRKARYTFGNANKKYFIKLIEAIENDAELGGEIQEEEDEVEEAPVEVHIKTGPRERRVCPICREPANNYIKLVGSY